MFSLKFIKGRQGTGYEKLRLLQIGSSKLGGVDVHILRYNQGDYIPPHIDPVTNRRHYRFNLELRKAKRGGILVVQNPILRIGRICIFRSDISLHSVSPIASGKRIILSIGIAI